MFSSFIARVRHYNECALYFCKPERNVNKVEQMEQMSQ
jgi:hypothetical protein